MQILQQVLPGVIIPGDKHLPAIGREARHQSDIFSDLHNDNALWAYACRMSSDFDIWRVADRNDPVMTRLFRMGLYDWKDIDNRLHQTTSAMRHAMVLSGCLFQRLLEIREQVGPSRFWIDKIFNDQISFSLSVRKEVGARRRLPLVRC